MIIVMSPDSREDDVALVVERLGERGYGHHISRGEQRTIIGAIGAPDHEKEVVAGQLTALPGVERVVPILKPYKLISREYNPQPGTVMIGNARFGPGHVGVIAGPCSIETREQILQTARAVKEAGATALRGGAFKPRTSPYSFQGLGYEGLELLAEAREETGLPIVTEVMDVRQVDRIAEVADCLQIGARNMQNYDLLKEAGRCGRPIMLKRGFSSTVGEWLRATEYIAAGGTLDIILCERGIRTFEDATRFTMDLSSIAVLRRETFLPVVADPSHAVGIASLVPPMALAAVAAGADGLLIEVHPRPDQALSDGPQSLTPAAFAELMQQIRRVAEAIGRDV
ncbi:MAG: 3-deoxy-7-phosphoheptulonate synthase [candidate division WS1 bacterium]|jgi:3-deoxy-7-phosphoheptulonate synthase|nr:3-deoxy-7-phosphoheptulonate synthase [candidate division WS1 bacterium]